MKDARELQQEIESEENEVKKLGKKINQKKEELSKRIYTVGDMFKDPDTESNNTLFEVAMDHRQPKVIINELKAQQKKHYENWQRLKKQLESLPIQERLM